MKTQLFKAALMAGLGCAGVTLAHAHRVWILPSTTVLSGTDQWVSVEAAVSNNLFFPNHRPVQLAQIDVRAPDGSQVEIKNATSGQIRSSFEVQLEKQGTYVISLRPGQSRGGPGGGGMGGGAPVAGAPAAGGPGGPGGQQGNLMGSWEENGQVKRWRGTPETLVSENMAAKPGFKLRSSGGRRVVTFVTCGKPTTDNLKPTGKDLEIEFVTHPNDLFSGEPATFRLLIDGKPAAGAEVAVVRGDDRFRNDAGEVTLTADADGVVKVNWPVPGRYWLEATATSKGELHGVPLEKSYTYIATFEALPQ